MKEYIPDELPALVVEVPPAVAYGVETTYMQVKRPATTELAAEVFKLCCIAVSRKTKRIENAYPAHLGGMEQYQLLQILAKEYGVTLQFPLTDDK